ncbi:MAG: hypothetical protein ACRD42_02655 [Nitrososphaeraceae archaeon]
MTFKDLQKIVESQSDCAAASSQILQILRGESTATRVEERTEAIQG